MAEVLSTVPSVEVSATDDSDVEDIGDEEPERALVVEVDLDSLSQDLAKFHENPEVADALARQVDLTSFSKETDAELQILQNEVNKLVNVLKHKKNC